MPPAEKELLSEHAVRVYRRQRWLGESNFVVMADPSMPGGEKLPIVSIIRMSKGPCCGTSMRRTCLDARYITQVELRDDWGHQEVIFEMAVLVFAACCWVIAKRSDAESDDEERRRDFYLWLMGLSIFALVLVIIINYVNITYFRGVRLVIDTCMPGAATVSQRMFRDDARRTENTAAHTAQQYVVTMTTLFAMEVRQHLQLWKHMGDNRRFALEAGKTVEAKGDGAAHVVSDTGNFRPYMSVNGAQHMQFASIPEARVVQGPPGNSPRRRAEGGGQAQQPSGAYGDNDQDIHLPLPTQ